MRELPCRLLPALPEQVAGRGDLLPAVPTWWPVPPSPTADNPDPEPLTDAQRAAQREAYRLRQALMGPWDGQAGRILVTEQGPPAQLTPNAQAPGFVYRLDQGASTDRGVVYRYDPVASYSHTEAMQAVTDAFAEAFPDYVRAARTDQPESQGVTMERIT